MRGVYGICSTRLGRYATSRPALGSTNTVRTAKLQLAVERAIEIIGEAARLISASFKEQHPEIPWQQIIAQRHVLAHDYGEISHDRIWLVATRWIPDLINQLEPLLPLPPVDPDGGPGSGGALS